MVIAISMTGANDVGPAMSRAKIKQRAGKWYNKKKLIEVWPMFQYLQVLTEEPIPYIVPTLLQILGKISHQDRN